MLRVGLLLCMCTLLVAADPVLSTQYQDLNPESSESLLEDASLKVPDLVRKYGYPLEVHEVTTDDGYILTMHRISHGIRDNPESDRPVVFVMHGLLCSSADWVVMGPGKGLAYILAEEGFDVWLGNARGNRYSRRHNTLNPDSDAGFWQFSWDEIGNIDVPAMIDFVLEKSGKKQLHYIGHSQGTTSFFVMSSLRPEYNHKIISMNALAPVAFMSQSGPRLLKAIAPFTGMLKHVLKLLRVSEFLPNTQAMRLVGAKLCGDGTTTQDICNLALFLIGWNSEQFNKTMIPIQLGHTPAGASVHQFVHYGQSMTGKEFRRYDHGVFRNLREYKSFKPPSYDLSKVEAPVHLHYALADSFTHHKDVFRLQYEIGKGAQTYKVPLDSFNHLDFMWGIDAKALVYDKVIDIMKSYHRN